MKSTTEKKHKMMILITGANGMLAKDLIPVLEVENELIKVDVEDFDICNINAVNDFIAQ